MRKSAKQKGIEASPRIEASKGLTLDERVALLAQACQELGVTGRPTREDSGKVSRWLEGKGYEPMMFAAAASIYLSSFRSVKRAE